MLGDNMPIGATHCARVENEIGFTWLWARVIDGRAVVWGDMSWSLLDDGYEITELKPLNVRMVSK